MPYDSEGNFTRVHNWEEDRINDIDIVSDRHDEEDDNFASGLSNCMLRDGRCTMTGNLKMGTFQIKEVANGTLSTDAVNKSQLDSAKTELTNAMNTMLANLYPVGSLYIGTQSTCPMTSLIAGSTWEKIATQIVTDVNTTAGVKGNGYGLGLTDGTTSKTMGVNNYNGSRLMVGNYTNQAVGTSLDYRGDSTTSNTTIGVNTDASKSGLTADVTRTTLTLNIWRRIV